METKEKVITVRTKIKAPVENVWNLWNDPKHIVNWYNPSENWHAKTVENDLRLGGRFVFRLEEKNGSEGFDFSGIYNNIIEHEKIEFTLDDDRKVQIFFNLKDNETVLAQTFEAENINSMELQQKGWQTILDSFKNYVESSLTMETIHFEISINASADKVHYIMLDDEYFKQWSSEFNPDSFFKGSWQKGEKILFLGTDKDGIQGGMVSLIRENIPGKIVSIQHIGIVNDGKEIVSGPEIQGWAGAMENYYFSETNGRTLLSVDMDVNHQFKDYFLEAWPRALAKLKMLCEKA